MRIESSGEGAAGILETDILRRTAELVEVALRLPEGQRQQFIEEKTSGSPQLYRAAMAQLVRLAQPDETMPALHPGTGSAKPASQPAGMIDLVGTTTSGFRSPDETHPSADPQAYVSPRTQEYPSDPSAITSGLQIGNLVIEKLLAQGGMGAVYLAAQVEEGFRRQVAVKVVKPELATVGVMQRFFQERQVLASLTIRTLPGCLTLARPGGYALPGHGVCGRGPETG